MIKFVHFSDLHFNIPSNINISEFLHIKRIAGGINYLIRRKKKYSSGNIKFNNFLNFLKKSDSKINIFTGDLTSLGLKNELEYGKIQLNRVKKESDSFFFIPGNHDLYIKNSSYYQSFPQFNKKNWPIVNIINNIVFISLNSSKPNPRIIDSNGYIDNTQLLKLKNLINKKQMIDKIKILITHYPVFNDSGNSLPFRRKLINDNELLEIIKDQKNLLLLHGHIHKNYHIFSEKFNIHTFCSGSLTYEGRESFYQYEIFEKKMVITPGYYQNLEYKLDHSKTIDIPILK